MVYIYIYNCNWVDTRWQQYSTHLHTNNTQNTQNGTYIIKKIKHKYKYRQRKPEHSMKLHSVQLNKLINKNLNNNNNDNNNKY
jgi:hypothetical protein